jgi:polysaccharide export outer membrane protein
MSSKTTKAVSFAALLSVGCLVLLNACANSNNSSQGVHYQPSNATQSTATDVRAADVTTDGAADDSSAELEALWRERTQVSASKSSSGFTLGPGDVLQISVPMIPQLNDRTVRVSENDTIALPLIGDINVAGMTEQDLRQELASRLGRYMYNPQVEVFLKTPENRVVSVLGSVKAPGRYLVASRSDTIMTLLSRAGGTTDTAGAQILFFPAPSHAPPGSQHQGTVVASSSNAPFDQFAKNDSNNSMVDSDSPLGEPRTLANYRRGEPLVLTTAGPEQYLDMPVQPGDVLFVPAAGSVSVQGWVDKPGLFPITPGMTALGSVAAAGGALFTSDATLVRAERDGGRREIALDLPKIKAGQEPDVPVRGGDVIVVERSVAGAVPYSIYFLLSKLGLGVPIIP